MAPTQQKSASVLPQQWQTNKQDLVVQNHQLHKQVQIVQVSCHLHPPLWLWNMDPACRLWKKYPGFWNQMPEETSPHLLQEAQDRQLGLDTDQLPCGSTGTSSGNCKEIRNLHGSGMSHATTASPKPSFRAPWKVSVAVVSKGYAGQTTSKSGHPCPCQNCSQGPSAEKTRKGLSFMFPHPLTPVDPIGQGTEQNWSVQLQKPWFMFEVELLNSHTE